MRQIYMDNGSTSFPKAPGVQLNMINYLISNGSNVNRGLYESSYQAENIVYETRELLCEIFNFNKPSNVIFTKNITESLNIVIKGLLNKGDHVITSSLEHNAVMRPLRGLEGKGIAITTIAPCDSKGNFNLTDLSKALKANTKAVIMTHASNVSGDILNLEQIGKFCRDNRIYFIIDTAQTAGLVDVDFIRMKADIIGFTGHKALLGPQGTGGFLITDELADLISPLIEGGTGSKSELELQPMYLPDKYEGGTLNIVGIYGLNAALKYLKEIKISTIRNKEMELANFMLKELNNISSIRVIGSKDISKRTSVISIDCLNKDNAIIAHQLNKKYGVMTRVGLHCAPSAHKYYNTFPKGTIRFGLGHFNQKDEISYTVKHLKSLLE